MLGLKLIHPVARAFGIEGIDTIRLSSLADATASVIAVFVGDCFVKVNCIVTRLASNAPLWLTRASIQ